MKTFEILFSRTKHHDDELIRDTFTAEDREDARSRVLAFYPDARIYSIK